MVKRTSRSSYLRPIPGNKQLLSMDQLVDVMVLDVTMLYLVLSLGLLVNNRLGSSPPFNVILPASPNFILFRKRRIHTLFLEAGRELHIRLCLVEVDKVRCYLFDEPKATPIQKQDSITDLQSLVSIDPFRYRTTLFAARTYPG